KQKPVELLYSELTNRIARIYSPEITEIDSQLEALNKQLSTTFPEDEKSPGNGYHSGIETNPDAIKWVQIDLGKSLPLEEIRLIPARPVDFPDTPGFGFPVRFRVEASDEPGFASAQMISNHTSQDFKNVGDNTVAFAAMTSQGRFIRVTAA